MVVRLLYLCIAYVPRYASASALLNRNTIRDFSVDGLDFIVDSLDVLFLLLEALLDVFGPKQFRHDPVSLELIYYSLYLHNFVVVAIDRRLDERLRRLVCFARANIDAHKRHTRDGQASV